MESPGRPELFEYYNERAPEYEDFYLGIAPTKLFSQEIYRNDTQNVLELVPDYVKGKCLDVACGTGYWMPAYQKNCPEITLIDQSESALAECRKKIDKLGIHDKTEVVQGELFNHLYKANTYDSVLLGFLISHLTDSDLDYLISIIAKAMVPGGRLTIIDSNWSDEWLKARRTKDGMITRRLKDGREFEIYKRFFEPPDLENFAARNNIQLEIPYWGEVFFLASGTFIKD